MKLSEKEMFPEKDSLPKEWDFILEPNLELELLASLQLKVTFGQQVKNLTLLPSTLTGEYSLVNLKKLIFSSFNLRKNSSIQICSTQTRQVLQSDSQFLKVIQRVTSPLSLQICLFKEEEPCILCVRYECCHSTTRSFGKKRKEGEHDTLVPDFLEPVSSIPDLKNKRRKLALSGSSLPNSTLSVSHAFISSVPQNEILIKF